MKPRICFVEGEDERIQKAIQLVEGVEVVLASDITAGMKQLQEGVVDGLIGGAVYTTKELITRGLRTISTQKGFASSYFLMKKGDKELLFADCGFNVNPDAKQLAHIALQTIDSAKKHHIEPRVAFVSYSTKGSAQGESVQKIREAVSLVKKHHDVVDGELQIDAALNPEIAQKKCPNSILKGDANIIIFPDLNAGNCGYKLLTVLGGFEAIGPILQGFKKPLHDLSRGASVSEIVASTHIMRDTLKH